MHAEKTSFRHASNYSAERKSCARSRQGNKSREHSPSHFSHSPKPLKDERCLSDVAKVLPQTSQKNPPDALGVSRQARIDTRRSDRTLQNRVQVNRTRSASPSRPPNQNAGKEHAVSMESCRGHPRHGPRLNARLPITSRVLPMVA